MAYSHLCQMHLLLLFVHFSFALAYIQNKWVLHPLFTFVYAKLQLKAGTHIVTKTVIASTFWPNTVYYIKKLKLLQSLSLYVNGPSNVILHTQK